MEPERSMTSASDSGGLAPPTGAPGAVSSSMAFTSCSRSTARSSCSSRMDAFMFLPTFRSVREDYASSVDSSTSGVDVLPFGMMTGPTDTDSGSTLPSLGHPDNPAYYEALGRAIRVLRTERGMERKDLAEAAGLSYPYVSEIETGKKRASSKALFVIAQALGVRTPEVLALGDRYVAQPPSSPIPSNRAARAARTIPPPAAQP